MRHYTVYNKRLALESEMTKQRLVRLISSKSHQLPLEELVQVIHDSGTDRYDADRSLIFNDYYKKYNVDFFAEKVAEPKLDEKIKDMMIEFPNKTTEDRGNAVSPDIAIIYDAEKCEMIENVYNGQFESDCFRFKTLPKDALVEVRIVG